MWCRASPVPVTAGNQTTSAASTYEDAQSNRDITLLASAARTASINSSDITNVNHRGVTVVIEATAATLTPSVVFTIQGKDAVSGVYYTLLASAAVTASPRRCCGCSLGLPPRPVPLPTTNYRGCGGSRRSPRTLTRSRTPSARR